MLFPIRLAPNPTPLSTPAPAPDQPRLLPNPACQQSSLHASQVKAAQRGGEAKEGTSPRGVTAVAGARAPLPRRNSVLRSEDG